LQGIKACFKTQLPRLNGEDAQNVRRSFLALVDGKVERVVAYGRQRDRGMKCGDELIRIHDKFFLDETADKSEKLTSPMLDKVFDKADDENKEKFGGGGGSDITNILIGVGSAAGVAGVGYAVYRGKKGKQKSVGPSDEE
jgi:hypothetical protein